MLLTIFAMTLMVIGVIVCLFGGLVLLLCGYGKTEPAVMVKWTLLHVNLGGYTVALIGYALLLSRGGA